MIMGAMQSVWSAVKASPWAQDNERLLFTVGFYVVHNVVFWGINGTLALLSRSGLIEKYKIQKGKEVPTDLTKRALLEVFVSHFFVNFVLLYYLVYPLVSSKGLIGFGETVPRLRDILWQIPVCMVTEDFFFYWTHRLLHHRAIYKYVHKKHHEFKVNMGLAAEYSHPIEATFGVFLPFFSGPMLLRVHFITLCVWLTLRTTEAIDAHSGYRFPWSPFQLLDRIQGGSERHEFHHSNNQGSFGSFFTFWDWFTGSDAPYRAYQITNLDPKKRATLTETSRLFSLNLADTTSLNIAKKLRDNVAANPEDRWTSVTLDGQAVAIPKEAAEYEKFVIPEAGKLRFTYVLKTGKSKAA